MHLKDPKIASTVHNSHGCMHKSWLSFTFVHNSNGSAQKSDGCMHRSWLCFLCTKSWAACTKVIWLRAQVMAACTKVIWLRAQVKAVCCLCTKSWLPALKSWSMHMSSPEAMLSACVCRGCACLCSTRSLVPNTGAVNLKELAHLL
eukprot:1140229-Pelagomonas_calceolata.AAC.1